MKPVFPSRMLPAVCALALVAIAWPATAGAQQPPPSDKWTFRFTPYLWVPSIDGTLNYSLPPNTGGGSVELPIGPEDYVGNLEFAFAAAFEGRHGNWSLVLDGMYVDLSARGTAATLPIVPGGPGVRFDAELGLTQFLGNAAVGYTVARSDRANLDVIAGVRYAHAGTEADLEIEGPLPGTLPSRHFERDVDIVDAIAGVRGRVALGGRWTLPYHLDVGTGDSNFTWQALTGVDYGFGWGDLLLVYRHMAWDLDNKVVEDLQFSGPALALSFRF